MKKKNEKKMKLGAVKVTRLNAVPVAADKHITIPTTTVHRTFDCL
ncbi:hypothetical protein [Chitinophaga arvensicola]|uniref:Uncharacterized protein n=1 Tax=Chitinophaga arvensicola TaxID=29529 RepID=A0A1I0S837_9BACT|nr:hypothetical protein [Chitinophaga arvensicola]SEW52061.1 hypothetical protein SAMN04488122_4667 [Chitinophaga arvensicola]